MSELCEYELKRLDQIERNKEMLRQLGINDAVAEIHAAHQPTKAKPKKQKAKAAPKGPTRKSRRLDGEADSSDGGDDNSHNSQYESRDPNDVSGMTESEFHRFVDDVRLAVLETVLEMEHLSEEHCERLRAANDPEAGWLGPFAVHTARYGSVGEGPISKPNLRSCLKSVMQLASGAGFHSDKKETGTFAAARPIHLGWTAAGCDALRAEAQLWLPLEKAPADIVGMQVPSGETVPARPTRKLDLSNGWALNHPLIKVKKYCEHLDEVRRPRLLASRLPHAADTAALRVRGPDSAGRMGGRRRCIGSRMMTSTSSPRRRPRRPPRGLPRGVPGRQPRRLRRLRSLSR